MSEDVQVQVLSGAPWTSINRVRCVIHINKSSYVFTLYSQRRRPLVSKMIQVVAVLLFKKDIEEVSRVEVIMLRKGL